MTPSVVVSLAMAMGDFHDKMSMYNDLLPWQQVLYVS